MSSYASVFKDETKLDINYIPQKLPHRETELRLLTQFFSFVLQSPDKMAQRVLIVGDVGTGKTMLCQRFGENITHEANKCGMDIRYIHVNCRENRGSLFMIMQQAVTVFHPNFPRRGYSAEEILKTFLQILDEEKTHVILTLDEAESLVEREGSDALYKLSRLGEARLGRPQRISLICIVRSLRALDQLDQSTKSTLQSNIISLDKYLTTQLTDILNDRVALAFRQASVPEDTVDLIAELASSENGNARFGIELLWRAGKYANAAGLGTVVPDCVRKAVSSVVPALRKSDLSILHLHQKLFLLGLARAFKESQKARVSLASAERAYSVVCEEFEKSPNSHTQLWKYLQELSKLGIVRTEVSNEGGRGRSTLISLPRIPADALEKELRGMLERSETSKP